MDGLEENMKLILAPLKIEHVGSTPPPTVEPTAGAASSSAKNVDKAAVSDIVGDTMKVKNPKPKVVIFFTFQSQIIPQVPC